MSTAEVDDPPINGEMAVNEIRSKEEKLRNCAVKILFLGRPVMTPSFSLSKVSCRKQAKLSLS